MKIFNKMKLFIIGWILIIVGSVSFLLNTMISLYFNVLCHAIAMKNQMPGLEQAQRQSNLTAILFISACIIGLAFIVFESNTKEK